MTLERLLEAACPYCPSRWLRLCKNVVRQRDEPQASHLPGSTSTPGRPTRSLLARGGSVTILRPQPPGLCS